MNYSLIGFIVLYVLGIYGFYFVDHLVNDYTNTYTNGPELGSKVASLIWPISLILLGCYGIITLIFKKPFDKIYEITQEDE